MWANKNEVKKKIEDKKIKIGVIGLGYVGLNIACLFAKSGFKVNGYDTDKRKIDSLNKMENYLPEESWLTPVITKVIGINMSISSDSNVISSSDIIIIAVPTAKDGKPYYNYMIDASKTAGKYLSRGAIVLIESTVAPGTTEGLVKESLEKSSGLKVGEDFGLAFSPERIDPGNKQKLISNIPKIVGGFDELSTEIITFLYSRVIEKVFPVSNPRTAEMVKVMENTQRDVNIALTNLFAKAADSLNIDIEEVLDAASTKWNFIKMKPSCGVGGQCIGDVTYLAIESMDRNKIDSSMLKETRNINESMPEYALDKLAKGLKKVGKDIKTSKIAVLGLAYKGDSTDTKNSPALAIINLLKKQNAIISIYDPFVKEYTSIKSTKTITEALKGCDAVIVATDHSKFKGLKLPDNMVVIDGRNILNKTKNYYGIGR